MSENGIIFVGQAFNREFGTMNRSRMIGWLKRGRHDLIDRFVSHYALTGAAGNFLGGLTGKSRLEFCAEYRRTNLNIFFTGKKGKGDEFDTEEGMRRAAELIRDESLTKYVLLGAKVAACFAVALGSDSGEWKPLWTFDRGDKAFFCLPHPSGINSWWNERANREAAKEKLRAFLDDRVKSLSE